MPDISIEVSDSTSTLQENLNLILQHKLHFVRNSGLKIATQRILKNISPEKPIPRFWFTFCKKRVSRPKYVVAIAKVDGVAIGALLLDAFYLQFFVAQEYRKQGIAKMLLEATSKRYDLSVQVLNTSYAAQTVKIMKKLAIPVTFREMRQQGAIERKNRLGSNV